LRGEEAGELPSQQGEVPVPPQNVFEQFNVIFFQQMQRNVLIFQKKYGGH